MNKDSSSKDNAKTAAGYNNKALRQETLSSAQQKMLRDPLTKQWKSGEKSPLSPILGPNPAFKILIVEDNRPIRNLIRSILLAFGVQNIDEADDGMDAIRQLQVAVPDLVITDLEMAPMNGLEFTRQVRQNPSSPNPDLPIVIMTSYTEIQRIMEIKKAGLTEIMAKPVTPKLLSRNILVAMERYEQRLKDRLKTSANKKNNPASIQNDDDETKDTNPDFFVI